jgi:hypothetical protein
MDKQDKILKILQEANKQADALTATQARELVNLLVQLTTKQKEDLISKNEDFLATVSQETFSQIQDALLLIKEKANDNQLEVRQLTNKQRIAHEAKMSELEALISELRAIEIKDGIDGQDADEEKIVQDVLAQIPQETGDSVIKKINKSDKKIKKERVEGLETFIDQKGLDRAVSILDQRTQFLINKRSSTSTGGGTWGTITGVLSDQTDLQLALDAKQDDISLTTTGSSGPATFIGNTLNIPNYAGPVIDGSGTTNQLTYWVDSDTIGALTTATYPSLTELSYVKGVTSSIQTQLNGKQATLVSGTNIKTINSTSLLGSGDIAIPVVTFGTSNQIPFMNTGGTNFDYSANLTWDDNNLLVKSASTSMVSIQTTGASEQSQLRLQTDSGTMDLRLGGSTSGFSDYWFMWDVNNGMTPFSISSHASGRVLALGYGQTVGTQANASISIYSTGVVINESGQNYDFRVESDTVTNALFIEGTNGAATLGAYGTGSITGTPTYNLAVDSSGNVIEVSTGGGSGITRSVSSISSNTSAGSTASTDYVYFVTGTTTLTLPTAVGNTNMYTIKSISGTTVVATTSSQTIDGTTTIGIANQDSVSLISDGSNWNVV